MIKIRIAVICLLGSFLPSGMLCAKTVAWYRFEEEGLGEVVKGTVFTNCVDASKFRMYAGVCNFGGNSKFDKSKLEYTASYMPFMSNAFTTVELLDPQTGSCYPNNGSVSLNNGLGGTNRDPHSELFIDDDAELRLKTFTLEFFARLPDWTEGFRCLCCRAGGAYSNQREAFRIEASVLSGGSAYCKTVYYTTLDGEPLYDEHGVVTNQVTHSFDLNSNYNNLDDGKWHHFALVIDGVVKTVRFYIDYRLAGSSSYVGGGDIYYEPGYPFAFGGNPQCYYFNSAADFDEIRISDAALSPEQMLHYSWPKSQYTEAVDDRTLLYFPFEGSKDPQTVGQEMMQTMTYTPCLSNYAKKRDFAAVSAQVYHKPSASKQSDPMLVEDVPASLSRFGLRGKATVNNTQGVHIATNDCDSDFSAPLVVATSQQTIVDLLSESMTFEAFVKFPRTGEYLKTDNAMQMFGILNGFTIVSRQNSGYNARRLAVSFNGVDLKTATGDTVVTGAHDGMWHHVAFVYDKEAMRADFYLDRVWKMGCENTNFTPVKPVTSAIIDLLLGGEHWSLNWFTDFKYDEVRISRGALRPYEFLTTLPVAEKDADLLARATFDDGMMISPYADFFVPAQPVGLVVEDRSRPGKVIKERSGAIINEKNTKSLKFDGGTVAYADYGLMAAESQFTVELFVKAAASSSGEGLARINRGHSAAVTSAVTWALSFADEQGHLKVKVDTEKEQGQEFVFGGESFADGVWHHIGLQFAYDSFDPADTTINLYRDGVLVGSRTASGRILTNPRLMNFMLGAGESGDPCFTGLIDEIRITPGIVPVENFMTALRNGTVVIVR